MGPSVGSLCTTAVAFGVWRRSRFAEEFCDDLSESGRNRRSVGGAGGGGDGGDGGEGLG